MENKIAPEEDDPSTTTPPPTITTTETTNSTDLIDQPNQQETLNSPQIGHVYSAKRLDGEWHPAEVLETRINEAKAKKVEYFVHFENCKFN